MKRKKNFIESGFTFIELMIVILIMAFLFTVGFSNYREFARRRKLEGAVRSIVADLRLTQKEAIAGKKPAHVNCDTSQLVGYQVQQPASSKTVYQISALCEGGAVLVKTVDLTQSYEDIEISGLTGGVVFNALAQGVDSIATVTIDLTVDGKVLDTRSITISPGGGIE